jgi:hypothetical protein
VTYVRPTRGQQRGAVLLATRATVIVLLLMGLGIAAGMLLGELLVRVFEVLHLSRLGRSG